VGKGVKEVVCVIENPDFLLFEGCLARTIPERKVGIRMGEIRAPRVLQVSSRLRGTCKVLARLVGTGFCLLRSLQSPVASTAGCQVC
jgi:hypothetical protein